MEKKRIRKEHVVTYLFMFVLIGIALFGLYFLNVSMTGFAVFGEGPEIGQTTLTLQEADLDNLGDAYVGSGGDASKNFGTSNLLRIGNVARTYITFNLSLIPVNQNIDNATLCLYVLNTKKTQTINVSHVYSDWDELTLTWNNQPCGVDLDNSSACNLTSESFIQMNSDFEYTWKCWKVTDMINKDYNSGDKEVSIIVYTSDSDINSFNSKEASDSSLRPYLNITYSSADLSPPQISFSSSTTATGEYNQDNIFVEVDVADNSQTYSFINFDDSLVGFWKMNDTGSVAKDYSRYGNDGTINGSSSTTGKFGGALSFDGNDAIEIQHSASISINTPYSISAWIKPSDVSGMSIITSKDEAVWEMMMMVSNGGLYVGFENCVDDNFLGQGGTIIADNWQHVSYVYNGSRVLGYIDGVEVVNVDGSGTPCVSGHSLGIGDSQNGIPYSFNGTIDEVLIFNRALSEEEISALHNTSSYSHNFTDLSDGSYNFYAYSQDTLGNENQTETRTVDLVSNVVPFVNIMEPQNQLYIYNESLNLNFSAYDSDNNLDSCWYSIDWGTNITLINCQNTTFNVSMDGTYVINLFANDSEGLEINDSVSFNVDVTGVSVILSEPSGTKSSRTEIPITYSVIGNNLTCWYNIKTSIGGGVIENTTLENCSGLNFDVSADGDYVLNLYVNNTLGSSAFDSSGFSVSTGGTVVVSSGGGGGGGSRTIIQTQNGTIELVVGEISDLIVDLKDIKKVSWHVKNTGTNFLNNCKLKGEGGYSSWIFSDEIKNLASGEEYEFVFDLIIPEIVEAGKYDLTVSLVCQEVSEASNFVVEIIEKKLIFDLIKVERVEKNKVKIVYSLEELSGIEQDIELQFLLFGSGKEKLAEVRENQIVSANLKQEFEILIPIESSLEGELKLLVNLNSEDYSNFVQENIILGAPISGFAIFGKKGNTDQIISFVFVILFLVFAFFIVRRIVKHRKKKRK